MKLPACLLVPFALLAANAAVAATGEAEADHGRLTLDQLDASSLFLTPEPTVFIQSKAGNGGCLRDVDGQVRLASCPDVSREGWQHETGSQWQLDM